VPTGQRLDQLDDPIDPIDDATDEATEREEPVAAAQARRGAGWGAGGGEVCARWAAIFTRVGWFAGRTFSAI
jgi:hypothetical protein